MGAGRRRCVGGCGLTVRAWWVSGYWRRSVLRVAGARVLGVPCESMRRVVWQR
jgi:hypothetical protein